MTQRVETAQFTFVRGDDGIVRLRFAPGVDLTLDLAKRCVAAGFPIFDNYPSPLLADFDNVRSMSREARGFFSKTPGPTAVALVAGSPIARVIGNMFIGLLGRTPCPARIFGTKEEAVEWLVKHGT